MFKPIFFVATLFLFNQSIFAESKLTIINHYSGPLKFTLKNNKYAPSLPLQFELQHGARITSPILMAANDCSNSKFSATKTYIRADNELNNAFDFFSVERDCLRKKQVDINGYLDNKIAYSWKEDKHAYVIFCDPKNYPCG